MTQEVRHYGREDILDLKNSQLDINSLDIVDYDLLNKLSSQKATRLCKTKRGKRAGRRLHKNRGHSVHVNKSFNRNHVASLPKARNTARGTYTPSLLYTNCRSLNTWKLAELEVYAEIHHPNIICLTETWLNEEKQQTINVTGYTPHFCHRKSRIGGGVCILLQDHLNAVAVSSETTSTYSALWVKINIKSYYPIIVACIYHPPNADESKTLDYLSTTLLKLHKKFSAARFIIAGDFNRLPVEDLCEQFALTDLVNFPTRLDNKLDLVLTDLKECKQAVKLAPLAENDHCCIMVNEQPAKHNRYVKVTRRIVTPGRKNDFLAALAQSDWSNVLSETDIQKQVSNMHATINCLLDKFCPLRTYKQRHDKPPWITPVIEKTIKARDKAHSSKKSPGYKFLKTTVQRMIRTSKRKFVGEQLNEPKNAKKWWDTVKKITTNAQTTAPSGTVACISESQAAENLNAYYKSVGGAAVDITPQKVPSDDAVKSLEHISLGEIKMLLSKLDRTKACNSLDFPTWISIDGREDICIPVQHIINTMLDTGLFPDLWKKAEVKPLPKVKTPKQYKDYRPISLLFHLGKLAEQIIINKLRGKLADIIEPKQFAYQQKIGTVDALLQLIDDITCDLDQLRVKFVQLASLDFSKAFDRLQPAIVLEKMTKYGFNQNVINLVSDFLMRRQQCVKFGKSTSDYLDINVGAPQGTKLGPVLWLIYINDLQVPDYKTVKYADDTSFYLSVNKNSEQSVASAIEHTSQWSANNHMILNADKTVIINFYLNYAQTHENPVIFENTSLNPANVMKFLGITIDDHLTFIPHVNLATKSCNSKLFLMRQLKKLGMNSTGLCNFYCSNIRSALCYGASAYFQFLSDTTKLKLEQVQMSATKIIFPDVPYPTRLAMLELCPLSDFILNQSESHFRKIATDNTHPLYKRITFNTSRRSSRCHTVFRPLKARTEKHSNSFFTFYMNYFNQRDHHF